ncbi:MAG TPA: helix-turn-helix transcriptional regulator [Thermoanaerobaculia bacterium]
MPKTPSQNNLALLLLRVTHGWNQKELAQASGVQGNLLSDYERGRKPLSRERLEMLASAMGLTAESIEQAFAYLRQSSVAAPVAGHPSDAQRRRIELVASDIAAKTGDFVRWALARLTTAARAEEERQEAEALWARLKTRKPAERRKIVEAAERFRSWALCELVCRESVDAARDSADRALELADLALHIAELTPGDEAWRSRVQGYAWAHVGNARRVKGNLPAADEAFRNASKFWQDGEDTESDILDGARLWDLEASLRRAQGRFKEALDLLDQALSVDRGVRVERILLKKATVLEALGAYEEAVLVLRRAAHKVEVSGDLQLLFALRFNLAVNLWFLQRYEEAERLLPDLRKLAVKLGKGLDLVRLHWLEGRLAAGLRNFKEAIAAFAQVQEDFTAREIGFEAALASLELSVLYLEEGRTKEVRTLARQMMWIFQAQKIHRETLAALRLFCEAAEQEAITLELTRKVLAYLYRAQYNPNLRFEVAA